jgi:large subunit ribosomal protein L5
MREIRIEKVTLNVGCGDDPEKIERAKKLLEKLTERRAVITRSRRRSTFGVAKGKPIGVKVTLRKSKAVEFLKLALEGVEKELKASQFDQEGNFSFGIREYIDLPKIKYDHEIGMLGFDVTVSLERPGFRIKRRRIRKRRIPTKQKISREEAMEWLKKKFGVKIGGG